MRRFCGVTHVYGKGDSGGLGMDVNRRRGGGLYGGVSTVTVLLTECSRKI